MLRHCEGLVFGFVFRGERAIPVKQESLAAALEDGADWCWLHLALADHRTRKFLDTLAMPEEARVLMTLAEDRVQLHLTPAGGWGVLPDIEHDFADQSLGTGRFAFWCDGAHLVTTRRHPLRAVEGLRREAEQGVEALSSPAEALLRLGQGFVALVEQRLQNLSTALARIEDAVLAGHLGSQDRLGPLRRELSRYAREFSAVRGAIHRATGPRARAPSGPLAELLPALLQEVEDVERDAAALTDRARLLNEEMENRLAAAANRSLSALTVISTLLLPPTFVVGAFGMNVPGLPWSQSPHGFWTVLGFCVVLIAVSYAVLRRFRILP